jgi:NADP-dependent 3-hydroxy acid dehydrogenase YdfG
MARAGAHVVLADRQLDLAEQVTETIRSEDGSASAAALDVRDLDAKAASESKHA